MLILTAKLMELNEDGLWLVRLLQNERYATTQGATVRLDKFSTVYLRSTLSYERRFRTFDAMGKPRKAALTDEQETQLARALKFYGEYAAPGEHGLWQYAPMSEAYNQHGRCAHCYYSKLWDMDVAETGLPHGLTLGAPGESHASQINRMGTFGKWWVAFGGFEPIAPREGIDRDTRRAIDALFGRPARDVAIDPKIYDAPPAQSNN